MIHWLTNQGLVGQTVSPSVWHQTENGPLCGDWSDSLTDHIKRSPDHPNSVCTAARQPRTLKHWHVLLRATERVLTQTRRGKKPWSLCNTLRSDTSYPSPWEAPLEKKKKKEKSVKPVRDTGVARPVCACVHGVVGGCGRRCLIRALRRSVGHGGSVLIPRRWASHSSGLHASMHGAQQGMLKHSCKPPNPDLQAQRTETTRGTTHSRRKWTTPCLVNDWQSCISNLYLDNLQTMGVIHKQFLGK